VLIRLTSTKWTSSSTSSMSGAPEKSHQEASSGEKETTSGGAALQLVTPMVSSTTKVRQLSGGANIRLATEAKEASSAATITLKSRESFAARNVVPMKSPLLASAPVPTVVAPAKPESSPSASSPATIVLAQPAASPASVPAVAVQHIRVPTVPTQHSRPTATTSPGATLSRIPATTAAGIRTTVARAVLPMSTTLASTASVGGASVTMVAKPAAGSQPQTLPVIAPAVAKVEAKPLPVNLTVADGAQKVTVVHAPATQAADLSVKGGSSLSASPSGKPLASAVTLSTTGVPVAIRAPASGGKPGVANIVAQNNPIQLVPISSGNARPTLVQQGRGGQLKTTVTPIRAGPVLDQAASPVRVTLIGSSATITKISPANITTAGSKPTIVGTIATQAMPRPIAPQVIGQAQTQPQISQIRIGAESGVTPTGRVAVIPSGAVTASGSGGVSVALNQLSVQPVAGTGQGQSVARIITPTGGTRLLNMPSSASVSIQKTLVNVTNMVTQGIKTTVGSSPISVPKPVGLQQGAVPVARVIPQALPTSGTAATGLFLSRARQAPVSATELPLVMTTTLAAVGRATGQQPIVARAVQQSVPTSPSKPGILRRREADREANGKDSLTFDVANLVLLADHAHIPELSITRHGIQLQQPQQQQQQLQQPHQDDESSSGSTTLSATSENDGEEGSGKHEAPPPPVNSGPSPRKKPRKQQHLQVRQGSDWPSELDQVTPSEPRSTSKRKLDPPPLPVIPAEEDEDDDSPSKKTPRPQLVNSYRHTWKSRHNHFLRRSDVRVKDERKPTVNELAAEKHVVQKLEGWKMYHLTAQMEDVVTIETELSQRLSSLGRRLERASVHREAAKDVARIQEIIKANLQRSKVIQDQVLETKENSHKVFEHKKRVRDIVGRYLNKRTVKKRELR